MPKSISDQPAVVGEQHIAGVRIAVKHSVDGNLFHVRRQQVAPDGLRIARIELRPRYVRQVSTAHEAQREHALRRVLGIHGWRTQLREVGDLSTDQARIVRFQPNTEKISTYRSG